MSKNILLCGLPMSGKSTIGKLAARKLSRISVDLDALVENLFKEETGQMKSCREIFIEKGEQAFREIEHRALERIPLDGEFIISLGGGTLSLPANRERVKKIGTLVYLKEDPEVIFSRLLSHGKPAFIDENDPKKSFQELAAKRCPLFEQEADRIIDIKNRTPQAVLEEFIRGL